MAAVVKYVLEQLFGNSGPYQSHLSPHGPSNPRSAHKMCENGHLSKYLNSAGSKTGWILHFQKVSEAYSVLLKHLNTSRGPSTFPGNNSDEEYYDYNLDEYNRPPESPMTAGVRWPRLQYMLEQNQQLESHVPTKLAVQLWTWWPIAVGSIVGTKIIMCTTITLNPALLKFY
ncbi:hypothetical protein GGX14DRAFT_400205 [Mycena pura]|uniref:Uncharacterized protein n=1 Tax=Mycena pura TaxID=153505 RepID=A0AAD6V314_9AGAR|nr:hypothetical protein GGX14DRAFT_400205 [Mycena pura]